MQGDLLSSRRAQLRDRGQLCHWTSDRLRWTDTDSWGHINHTLYPVFCDSGSHAFMLAYVHPHLPPGQSLMVARLTINYEAEAFYPNDIEIGTVPLAVGRSSFSLGHGLFVADQIVATAETVFVNLARETRRSVELPPVVRSLLVERVLPEPQPE